MRSCPAADADGRQQSAGPCGVFSVPPELSVEDGGGGRDAEPDRREASGRRAGSGRGLGGLEPRGGGLPVPRHDRTQTRR